MEYMSRYDGNNSNNGNNCHKGLDSMCSYAGNKYYGRLESGLNNRLYPRLDKGFDTGLENGLIGIVRNDIYSKLNRYMANAPSQKYSICQAKERFQKNYLVDMLDHQKYGNISKLADDCRLSREHCSRLINSFGLAGLVNHYRVESSYQNDKLDSLQLDSYQSHRLVYTDMNSAFMPYQGILKEEVLSGLQKSVVSDFSGDALVDYISNKVFEQRKKEGDFDYKKALADFELIYVSCELEKAGNDKHTAANNIGVNIRTIERHI